MIPRSADSGNIDTTASATHYSRIWSGSACNLTRTEYPTYVSTRERKLFVGFDIEDFHKRKARGELLPHTPFYSAELRWDKSGGSLKEWAKPSNCVQNEWLGFTGFLDVLSIDTPVNDWITESGLDSDYYVQAAAAAIYGRGWDALSFLGELKETYRLTRSILTRLIKMMGSGKFDPNKAMKWYLEGRYGWRPLLYDLESLYELIKGLDLSRTRFSERQGASVSLYKQTSSTPYQSAALTLNRVTTDQVEVSCRGSVVADIRPPTLMFNIPITAWELTKLSFVIDWVLNVTQWLLSLNFLAFTIDYRASYGYRVAWYRSCEISGSAGTDTVNYGGSFGGSSASSLLVVEMRTPASVSKVPQIVSISRYLNVRDLLRGLDLLAIYRS